MMRGNEGQAEGRNTPVWGACGEGAARNAQCQQDAWCSRRTRIPHGTGPHPVPRRAALFLAPHRIVQYGQRRPSPPAPYLERLLRSSSKNCSTLLSLTCRCACACVRVWGGRRFAGEAHEGEGVHGSSSRSRRIWREAHEGEALSPNDAYTQSATAWTGQRFTALHSGTWLWLCRSPACGRRPASPAP